MKSYSKLLYSAALLLCGISFADIEAGFVIKDGWIADADEIATLTVEEHYNLGVAAMEKCDWKEAAKQFRIVTANFPKTELGQDSFFYLGVAFHRLGEYDFANEAYSEYLKCHSNPQYFEEVITYKFDIANCFKHGARCHMFGTKHLPKWSSGRSTAIAIYDEIIAAVPCHELAAWSLFVKAQMLREDHQFRESIDVYQLLIRRFPKHELAPQSYLAISKIYIQQSTYEMQNPDLLAFSQINLRRFSQDFPRDERIKIVEQDVQNMKEIYAGSLYETGQFYERTKHQLASVIYYQNAIDQFPDTAVAELCRSRLEALKEFLPST